MIAAVLALLLAAEAPSAERTPDRGGGEATSADPAPEAAKEERSGGGTSAEDEAMLRDLELLEKLELLQNLELFDQSGG